MMAFVYLSQFLWNDHSDCYVIVSFVLKFPKQNVNNWQMRLFLLAIR